MLHPRSVVQLVSLVLSSIGNSAKILHTFAVASVFATFVMCLRFLGFFILAMLDENKS